MLASATLIVIFSAILYNYIKISVYEDLNVELTKEATKISTEYYRALGLSGVALFRNDINTNGNNTKIVVQADKKHKINFEQYKQDVESFLTIY